MVGEIKGESIKSAIALKLRSGFAYTNSDTPPITIYPNIYKEKIVQGMKKPAFFIWVMDVRQEKLMRNNYERFYQMNIRYHPEENDTTTYETLADIGNKLFEVLLTIDVPIDLGRKDSEGKPIEDKKPVRGSQMDFTIQDDILQFFVTYKIDAKQYQDKGPEMETLEIINN
ncbi:MAG: hypothetical protein GX962_12925 [Epulopiscium sp.]|mgnify:CR=1 FL=1|nr:hypothetical protein [Candidatus Epulonipiscium sp.]